MPFLGKKSKPSSAPEKPTELTEVLDNWWDALSHAERAACDADLIPIFKALRAPGALVQQFPPATRRIDAPKTFTFVGQESDEYGYPNFDDRKLRPWSTIFDADRVSRSAIMPEMTLRMLQHHRMLKLTGRLLEPPVPNPVSEAPSAMTERDEALLTWGDADGDF